ncbi:MAG: proline racemase family protein [Opitutaceae bacterium]|nr:proline racemase family protein [Opitutaceae bacterium]
MPPPAVRLRILDTHTGGEPTRVVLAGGPDLGAGPLAERAGRFRAEHERYRTAVVGEPRGSDAMVGALLVPPHEPGCALGVIFFNPVGVLGMCGHGTIGVVKALAHLGRLGPGEVRLDTPAGPVAARLQADGRVAVENVPSYRARRGLVLQPQGLGAVPVDLAWGGNWFGLVEGHGLKLERSNLAALTDYAVRVRRALAAAGFPEVDHVELFGPSPTPGVDSRSFVLCPGLAYDRSPCGTGTSAKLACLAADGRLAPGVVWVQESILGSVFQASYRPQGERIVPTITGSAYVTGEAELILDPADPLAWGWGAPAPGPDHLS